ncbi:MAG: class I SAM-dependent methyltransferase, partial [Myxococcota bacterium]|nr:class I SAM-dependent methyltransferase [Myxococcota bacterium]
YTDVEKAMQRVRGIAEPRVRWMTAVYEETYGRKPRTILDVGAGGGHFVRACLDAGYEAKGLEVSEPSRVFARNHFEIELLSEDFTNPAFDAGRPDIITFWGVIEHVTDPASLVEATARHLSEEGIVIAGVPKFNSVDTMIQTLCNDTVVRHLDPLGHINCFSENSLLTLFDRFAFDPASVWYFGMDAYEVLVQCGLRSEDPGFFERIKAAIPLLQQAIDRAALSDEVTLALRPR